MAAACGGTTRSNYIEPSTDTGTGGRDGSAASAGQPSYTTSCHPDCGPHGGRDGAITVSSAGAGAGNVPDPPADVSLVWPSSGCGRTPPPEQVATIAGSRTGYTEARVTQTGATLEADQPAKAGERQFFVRLPPDYDANKPYRVVYVLQGCGQMRAADKTSYALFETGRGTDEAVYVAVSVPDNDANPGCFDQNSGPLSQEWEAFDLIHSFVEATYCVDNNRIFSAGYSSGGWVSNMWGCYFGGTPSPPLDAADVAAGRTERKFSPRWAIRGHGSARAEQPTNQPLPCNGPSAGFWLTDVTGGQAAPLQGATRAVESALQANGCSGTIDGPKQAWQPGEGIRGLQGGICQIYTGCPADVQAKYPLVLCSIDGFSHTDMSQLFVPGFSAFAAELDPKP